jgi:hypothetical protein
MEPFVEACLNHRQPLEAMKYANLLPNKIVKCEMLFHISSMLNSVRYPEAIEAAKQVQNIDELRAMHDRLPSENARKALHMYISTITK